MNKLIISLIFAFSMLVPMQEVNAYCIQFVPKKGQTVKDAPKKLRVLVYKNIKDFGKATKLEGSNDLTRGALSQGIVRLILGDELKQRSKAEHTIKFDPGYYTKYHGDTPESYKEGACWGQDSIRDQDADDNGKMFYAVFDGDNFLGGNTFNIGRWVTITIDDTGHYYFPGN